MRSAAGGWTPPALALRPAGTERATSLLKAVMNPERFWPLEILTEAVVPLDVAGRSLVFISDAPLADRILKAPEAEVTKSRVYERLLSKGLGRTGISVASGERSRRIRRVFAPLFRPDRAASALPLVEAALAPVLRRWSAAPGGEVCLSADVIEITFGVVWRLMFGAAGPAPAWLAPVASRLHAAQVAGDLTATTREVDIAARRTLDEAPPGGGLFAPDDETLSPEEKFDNARQFLNAGYETTAPVITWCLWLLARDRPTLAAVQAELDAASRRPGFGVARGLPLLSAVLDETMRLYPPGAITLREARVAMALGGHAVAPGAILAVNLYALHRQPAWGDPHVFRPTRFLDGEEGGFLPFSAGRHVCIGSAVGRLECLAILAAVLGAFELVSTDPAVAPRMVVTLRPDRAVPMTLRRRGAV